MSSSNFTRRAVVGGALLLPATANAIANSDLRLLAEAGREFTSMTLRYRGVHFGTHRPIFYEKARTITRDAGIWKESGTEIHDGDVLTGPNALPRVRFENHFDPVAFRPLLESMTVDDKPVAWTYRFDHRAARVSGSLRFGGDPALFDTELPANALTGGVLPMLLASLPLQDDYRSERQLLAIKDGAAQTTAIVIAVKRRQFIRLNEQDVSVFRVEVTSDQPFVAGTGIYLVLTQHPHWLLRAEYQSTHMEGPPLFDSRGVDVMTSVGRTA